MTRVTNKNANVFFTQGEFDKLTELIRRKGVTKTHLMRQAFRLYALVEQRLEQGGKLYLSDADGKEKTEILLP